MKRFLPLIFLAIVHLGFALPVQAQKHLLIVTDEWAPYVYQDGGVVKGFDYEVMTAVLNGMGYKIDFRVIPWKRCLFMIEERKADAILDVSRNEKRKKTMYFPQENISESASVLFHQRGKQYSFDKLEDLNGLTIGTLLGYAYSKEFLEADNFVREPVKSLEQNFKKLLYGRVDLVISNRHVGLHTLQKMGITEKIEFIPKVVSSGNNYLAFSRKPGHDLLAEEFSRQLRIFKTSPEYTAIMRKYNQ